MKRRDFLYTLPALGTATWAASCRPTLSPQSNTVPDGEEWRQDVARIEAAYPPADEVMRRARADIERYRKGMAKFELFAGGKPLPDCLVKVAQQKGEVVWGCSGGSTLQEWEQSDTEKRKGKWFADLFDLTLAKCYWAERWHQPIEVEEGKRIKTVFEGEVAWGKQLGLAVKGHPLVWTVPKAIPTWVLAYDLPKQMAIMEAHVRDLAQTGGTDVAYWDVVNEMLWEPSLRNVPQRKWPHIEPLDEMLTYIEPAMRWAREAAPHAVLSLNDYGLVNTYRPEISAPRQRERYVELVQALQQRGAAPDAVGCQGHVAEPFHPQAFWQTIDDLAKPGLPVHITEFWAHEEKHTHLAALPPEEREQQLISYLIDMYTVAFSHPAMGLFSYWGNPFISDTGEPTAHHRALHQLLHQTWKTRWEGRTDPKGHGTFSGFYGKYLATIDWEGRRWEIPFVHTRASQQPIKIELGG